VIAGNAGEAFWGRSPKMKEKHLFFVLCKGESVNHVVLANFTTSTDTGCGSVMVTPADYSELYKPESYVAFGLMEVVTLSGVQQAETAGIFTPVTFPVPPCVLSNIQFCAVRSPKTIPTMKDYLKARGLK